MRIRRRHTMLLLGLMAGCYWYRQRADASSAAAALPPPAAAKLIEQQVQDLRLENERLKQRAVLYIQYPISNLQYPISEVLFFPSNTPPNRHSLHRAGLLVKYEAFFNPRIRP
jgi:hypothetical protein